MAVRPLHFTPPANEAQVLPLLYAQERGEYGSLRSAADRAAAKNPGMNTRLYTDFLFDYLDGAKIHRQKMDEAKHNGMDRQAQERYHNEMKQEFLQHVKNRIPAYGPDGQRAWAAFSEERKKGPGGVIQSVMQNFWDDRGPRVGGIIGGLLGVVAAFITTRGGGYGAMGLLLFPLQAMIGGWAGNKAQDWLAERSGNAAGASPSPAQSLIPPLVNQKISPQPAKDHEPELGRLSPPPVPQNTTGLAALTPTGGNANQTSRG